MVTRLAYGLAQKAVSDIMLLTLEIRRHTWSKNVTWSSHWLYVLRHAGYYTRHRDIFKLLVLF